MTTNSAASLAEAQLRKLLQDRAVHVLDPAPGCDVDLVFVAPPDGEDPTAADIPTSW